MALIALISIILLLILLAFVFGSRKMSQNKKIAGVVIVCVGGFLLVMANMLSLEFLLSIPSAVLHVLGITPVFILYTISIPLILGGTFLSGWDRRNIVFGVVLVAIGGFFALLVVMRLVSHVFIGEGIISETITYVFLCITFIIAGRILITFQKKDMIQTNKRYKQ